MGRGNVRFNLTEGGIVLVKLEKKKRYVEEKLSEIKKKYPNVDKHLRFRIESGKLLEDNDEDYVVLIVTLDGTPKSINLYRELLSEFYKEPERLKGIAILFKVGGDENGKEV